MNERIEYIEVFCITFHTFKKKLKKSPHIEVLREHYRIFS